MIEPFTAVSGMELVFDEALNSRIHPWNFEHLSERRLRGVIGCALSHLAVWEQIATQKQGMILIFEDDARCIDPDSAHRILAALNNVPPDADLVWLNDYDRLQEKRLSFRLKRRLLHQMDKLWGTTWFRQTASRLPIKLSLVTGRIRFQRWEPTAEKTAEAYLISPSYAKRLHEHIRNNIGAIDEHMRGYVAECGGNVYEIKPPLFTQANRADTDIQHP